MSKQISLDLESIRNIDRTIRSLQESLEDGENDLRNKHDNLTSLLDELSRNPDLAEFLFSQRCKLNLLKVSSEIFYYCKEAIEGCEKIAGLLPIDRLESLSSLQNLNINNEFHFDIHTNLKDIETPRPNHLTFIQQFNTVSQSAQILLKSTVACLMMGSSLFIRLATHPTIIKSVNRGVEITQNIMDGVELSNRTVGADWSPLADDSILKDIADKSEKNDNLHFGTEEMAELANEYADSEEEKNRKRKRESEKFFSRDRPSSSKT
jgi:hypothetical protein